MVSSITEQEYLGLESLVELFSTHLPHRGGLSPIFPHKVPIVPLREIDTTIARLNGQAIDKRTLTS